jgi:hypothetical protein
MVAELRAQVERWRAIRGSREASHFVDYLARYGPDGAFSEAAEQRLEEIEYGAFARASSPRRAAKPGEADCRTAPGRSDASATRPPQKRGAAAATNTEQDVANEPKGAPNERQRDTAAKPADSPVAATARNSRRKRSSELKSGVAATSVSRAGQQTEQAKLSAPAPLGPRPARAAPMRQSAAEDPSSRRRPAVRTEIMLAPAVVGVALAGALFFSGVGESNAVRHEADTGKPVAEASDGYYFDALEEAPDPAALQFARAPPAARLREDRRKKDPAKSLSGSRAESLAAHGASAAFAPLDAARTTPAEAPVAATLVAKDALGSDIRPDSTQGPDTAAVENGAGVAPQITDLSGAPLPGPGVVGEAGSLRTQDEAAPR